MSNNLDADRFPSRKNPRLKQYDYTAPNYYFVTICTRNKACIFGNCEKLSALGIIAQQKIDEITVHFPEVKVEKFIAMPNHVHAILVLNGNVNLSTVVGQYKSAVTKQIHTIDPNIQVWQTSFHDHVIRNQTDYERIWTYIDTNPARWMDDCFYIPEHNG